MAKHKIQVRIVDLVGDEIAPELFKQGAQVPVSVLSVSDREIVLVYRHDMSDKEVIQWAETKAGLW
jgi:hypothetical protein